jgi:hypothetical protein
VDRPAGGRGVGRADTACRTEPLAGTPFLLAPLDDSEATAIGIGGTVALSMRRALEGAKALSNTQTALVDSNRSLWDPSADWMKVKNPNSPAMIRARETEW